MKTLEQQPDVSNLQTLESEFSLTKRELDQFRKLPKAKQEEQKKELVSRLHQRQEALEQAIQEAIQTGKSDEVKRMVDQQQREIRDLEDLLGGDPEALRTEF
jgi:ABC-type transport system involved in cytochrome bd biosynthesis fused ATPase/permease subunit